MLDKIFKPESIAIIGASREEGKVGHSVLSNLVENEFPGKLYPINPKADEILGQKCYPSILDVPGDIDLAVFVVPAVHAVRLFDQCGEKKVPAAVIITAGFRESGREGAALEAELAEKVTRFGMRVVGPNCLGIIDTTSKINASFAAGMPAAGNIGFFSQSGALCTAILDWALDQNIGFSKFVSIGNKLDIDEADIMQEMAEDDNTDVILGYIEDVSDGEKFLKIARSVTSKKPVILIKSGGTEAGARAASSHTGALAGSEKAFAAAFHQTGIIRVEAVQHLFDCARAFSTGRFPDGSCVAIVTNSGGPGIIASDAVERSILKMADFNKETIEALQASLPASAAVYNPVDIIGDARDDRYAAALKPVLEDPNVDGVFVILAPTAMGAPSKVAHFISHELKGDKPLLAVFMGGPSVKESIDILTKASVPNYSYPEPAIAAMEAMAKYMEWRARPEPEFQTFEVDKDQVGGLLEEVLEKGQAEIGEYQAREILSCYGFIVPGSVIANNVSDAQFIAEKIGYPVVMKIASPDILHKSDVGGVRVGINNEKEVRDAFLDMKERAKRFLPTADIWGISVQEMLQGGKEVILGMMRDKQFGPVVMFGLGGIYVEVLKDVTFRIAPLSVEDAREMVYGIRSLPLLQGARGEKAIQIEPIIEGLLRLSQLVTDFPEIYEIDVNPLKVFPEGREPVALDARLTVRRSEVRQ